MPLTLTTRYQVRPVSDAPPHWVCHRVPRTTLVATTRASCGRRPSRWAVDAGLLRRTTPSQRASRLVPASAGDGARAASIAAASAALRASASGSMSARRWVRRTVPTGAGSVATEAGDGHASLGRAMAANTLHSLGDVF